MSKFINFEELRQFRETFAIALAGSVYGTFYTDPENPTPIHDLTDLAEEFFSFPHDEIDECYRSTVSWFAAGLSASIAPWDDSVADFALLDDAGVSAHHSAALAWARNILDRTHNGFGVRLLPRWGD